MFWSTGLVAREPENLTREFHKVDRRGRIFVDTGRNDYSSGFAAAYAVRARSGASLPPLALGNG
jgi:bifunctional non-homologous end joining protein LigD